VLNGSRDAVVEGRPSAQVSSQSKVKANLEKRKQKITFDA
jgi:hypothetical protein